MSKQKRIVLRILCIVATVVIISWGIVKYRQFMYDKSINDISASDIIIAFEHDNGDVYRFVITDENDLLVSFGRKKFYREEIGDGSGNIIARDFMAELYIEKAVTISDENIVTVLDTINDFIMEGATTNYLVADDAWYIVALTGEGIYRDFAHRNTAAQKLVCLLSELSPLVVELGWTGGVGREK